jgi:signal transduction histidine kinase
MSARTAVGVASAASTAVAGGLTAVLLAPGSGAPGNELAVLAVVTAYAVVAAVVARARPGHPVAVLMLAGAAVWGVGEGLLGLAVHTLSHGPNGPAGWLGVGGTLLRGAGWLVLVLGLPLVFPDGRTPWGGRRPALLLGAAVGLFGLATLLAPTPLDYRLDGLDSPTGLPDRLRELADVVAVAGIVLVGASLLVAVTGLVHRFRTGDSLRRQQLGWFAAAFAAPLLLVPFIPAAFTEPWMYGLVSIPVPVMIAIAVLQRRLYDTQLVVNRTVTYAGLSVLVAGIYAALVAGVGALLRDSDAPWLPWVAAGVVAVLFAPLRNALQGAANRLTYGQWAQPSALLASTGRRLADATDVPAVLRTTIDEMAAGLGLEHVSIVDARGRAMVERGVPGPKVDRATLTAYGRPVGTMRWSPAGLRRGQRALLDDLAGQIGGVLHSAGLLADLRDAQERLVLAHEEERRRLRRDLHDGLGPALAGLTLQVDTVRNVLAAGGDADEALLRLRAGVATTVRDVRRIVEGLRPPALDELGLAGALRQLTERTVAGSGVGVELAVPEDLPVLAAAVEVAAYRVAQEAVTNAVRHSRASCLRVSLAVQPGTLRLQVADDGVGGAGPRPGGLGLTTMYERAAELGGRLEVRSAPGRGTTVALRLPGGGTTP